MKELHSFIPRESLVALQRLHQTRIRFISGEPSPGLTRTLSDYNRILVATDLSVVAIELIEWLTGIRGENDDLGQLAVVDGSPFIDSVLESGTYSEGTRDRVVDEVYILREAITHSQFGKSDWTLVSDIGIALEFDEGAVLIYKAGYQSYLLEVTFALTVPELKTVDRNAQWDFSLEVGEHFSFEREFISVSELIRARGVVQS